VGIRSLVSGTHVFVAGAGHGVGHGGRLRELAFGRAVFPEVRDAEHGVGAVERALQRLGTIEVGRHDVRATPRERPGCR
jgi:hypothetical protein